ncbi:hypothetical protein CEXT_792971 [Caerostris extrusa]|uniref:Uncharacterized protein n=1 Tax=Caerostris extrusa TaxID=172846 RepID=A0AAV4T6V4_CAEEX|nr:hypothetical protein CEXT_792971 [Caerostris extrusa]
MIGRFRIVLRAPSGAKKNLQRDAVASFAHKSHLLERDKSQGGSRVITYGAPRFWSFLKLFFSPHDVILADKSTALMRFRDILGILSRLIGGDRKVNN